jgi:uncharacterized protein YjiS (DUF1127 family)
MVIPLHTATRRRAALRDIAGRMAASVRRTLHELAGVWRWAAVRPELAALDDHTLRDLGVHRSELGSYFAESELWTDATRRRLALLIDGRVGR